MICLNKTLLTTSGRPLIIFIKKSTFTIRISGVDGTVTIVPPGFIVKPRPKPTLPEQTKPNDSWFSFNFFNTPCQVRMDNGLKFQLTSIDEKSVSAVWQQLSGEASNALVADCFRLIDEMQLCDWAAICAFPDEKRASLLPLMPKLAERFAGAKTFKSEKYPEMSVRVAVNRNMMDFMESYPQCRHDNFVYMGLSESTKQAVYPVMRKAIEGKPLNVAADMLLNFMHTAFNYQSDIQQFGRERSFFGDAAAE